MWVSTGRSALAERELVCASLTVRHDTPDAATAAEALVSARALPGSAGCFDADVSGCIDSVYVHVPFCLHRCHYCDFYTIAGREDARGPYVTQLLAEAANTLPGLPMRRPCVFIGGGTPTYLPPADLARLLEGLGTLVPHPREWTIEANPETVTTEVARVLGDGPVTRVSMGMQSAQSHLLAALERQHDPASVPRAVERLRVAGIEALSLDLIFGIPDQTLGDVEADLEAALALSPDHVSVYGLVYEPGTPLRRRRDRGMVEPVDDALEAQMYLTVQAVLAEAGFMQYEISNWAKPEQVCQHNEVYWLNGNWWPLGPGAAGHVAGRRWRNAPRLAQWLNTKGLPLVVDQEHRDPDGRWGEVLMVGLRRLSGVAASRVAHACATPERGVARRSAIERHLAGGLLCWRNDCLCFTARGLLLGDEVIGDLL